MVDAVGGVAKIVGVALTIKEAASTARQNKKDCHHIRSRVDILTKTLSHHENNTELVEDSAVKAALEALDGILAEALEVITDCQEERCIVCVYYTAGNLSRQLSRVEQRISSLSSDAMLTIMSYHLLRKFQEGAPHPPPQISSPVTHMLLHPACPPRKTSKQNQDDANEISQTQTPPFGEWDANTDQAGSYHMIFDKIRGRPESGTMSEKNQDEANKKDQTQTSQVPKFGAWDDVRRNQAEGFTVIFNRVREDKAAPPYSSSAAHPVCKMVSEPRRLVKRIAEVARNIKETAETVLQNKDYCVEIAKLANKVSILLPQLEDTKMADKPAMRGAMEKLLATFRRAHTLVTACQRRGLAIVWLSIPPGRLSTQLHEVLDQIASNIADMTAIVLP